MATFWERAAHSVNHTFSLLCRFQIVVFCLPFRFRGREFSSLVIANLLLKLNAKPHFFEFEMDDLRKREVEGNRGIFTLFESLVFITWKKLET